MMPFTVSPTVVPAGLAALFPELSLDPPRGLQGNADLVMSWSGTHAGLRARRRAETSGSSFVLMGPGMLRGAPRANSASPLVSAAIVAIHGDPPRAGSIVERLDPVRVLSSQSWETEPLRRRAGALIEELRRARIGGAWWNPEFGSEVSAAADLALVCLEPTPDGEGDAGITREMLEAALVENPARKIVVSGVSTTPIESVRRLLDDIAHRGGTVFEQAFDPWSLFDHATRIYTTGGETGFLALLAGRIVRCFGPAFYAGWGATEDGPSVPVRPVRRSAEEIFAAACLIATRYRDPYRGVPTDFAESLSMLAEWRRVERANRRVAACLGMSFWKRRRVGEFFRASTGVPVFCRSADQAVAAARARSGAIAVWSTRQPPDLREKAARHGVPVVLVEDGFVRSVGLGSDFMPAASLVMDGRGMHFDPSVPSDLEVLLRETAFDERLLERARRLTTLLVQRGITKYNLGNHASYAAIAAPAGVRRLLVPGQVEDDLSVRLGGGEIRANRDLLARVRSANPNAFILYKPHPDVEAGHRVGVVPDEIARRYADAVVRDVSTAALLGEIDELHTLTSLAGFEALLRGRRVVTYGKPFYAGWGLTTDLSGLDRGRRLTLDQLVAGTLILYPRYLDPVTRLPCGPEIVVERLATPELWRAGALVSARRLQGALLRRWSGRAGRARKQRTVERA